MKYLILLLTFVSCQGPDDNGSGLSKELTEALQKEDTAAVKKIAQQDLDRMRASVTDSSFAALMDINIQLQTLGFELNKTDSSNKTPGNIIAKTEKGKLFYRNCMRVYQFAMERSLNREDHLFYTGELKKSQEQWLTEYFLNKSGTDSRISLLLLQKNMAIASAIINGVDQFSFRKETEEQYSSIIESIKAAGKQKAQQ
jgi:hypothetical protein